VGELSESNIVASDFKELPFQTHTPSQNIKLITDPQLIDHRKINNWGGNNCLGTNARNMVNIVGFL
jgi:hypothetical protein